MTRKGKKTFPEKFKNLADLGYFTSPKFTGLFGTEVLGFVPFWFKRAIKKDLLVDGSCTLKKEFLLRALRNNKVKRSLIQPEVRPNIIYDFVAQISRTYLSAYPSHSWARPTDFFSYQFLHPFIDSKFVSLICAFESEKYMPYKLYEKVFERHFPAYLEVPWTHGHMRKRHDMGRAVPGREDARPLEKKIFCEKDFVAFLKKSPIPKNSQVAANNLKELYFLFHWLKIYKTALDPSDIYFLTGDTLNP